LFNLGPMELISILVIALLVFGPRKLPELAKSLGRAMNEFKKASRDIQKELHETTKEIEKKDQDIQKELHETTQELEKEDKPDGAG